MTRFSRVVRDAIKHFLEYGYRSTEELNEWVSRIRAASYEVAGSQGHYMEEVTSNLTQLFENDITKGRVLKRHQGISRFSVEKLSTSMRAELDRRIMASADLIKINREKAIETTISRFVGWSTSIPSASHDIQQGRSSTRGTVTSNAKHIEKSAKQVDYEARRVMIDQGHKLIANIDNIIATENNAIAAIWHSHWRQPNYDYREDHKERDKHVYLIRGNWAQKKGYVKPGKSGYLDEVTQPGEEVFCRCYVTYVYNLRSVPAEMLTNKGEQFLMAA